MNQQLKTVLLTVLTLSVFVIALVELSGVSKTALINKFGGDNNHSHALNSGTQKDVSKLPKTRMKFEEPQYNLGTITEGDKATHSYKFTNTGSNPLFITNAIASCGCTVPSYPKDPIPPGGQGEIQVEFNSTGRVGHHKKSVMVYSNAEQEATSIGFDVEVKAK
jgi:hypothetical protein